MKTANEKRTTTAMAAEIFNSCTSCRVKVETSHRRAGLARRKRRSLLDDGCFYILPSYHGHTKSSPPTTCFIVNSRRGTTKERARAPISMVRRHSTLCFLGSYSNNRTDNLTFSSPSEAFSNLTSESLKFWQIESFAKWMFSSNWIRVALHGEALKALASKRLENDWPTLWRCRPFPHEVAKRRPQHHQHLATCTAHS